MMPTMFLRSALLGASALTLAACAGDDERAEVETTTAVVAAEPACVAVEPVYATVVSARPVRVADPRPLTRQDAVLVSADASVPGAARGEANAVEYTVETRQGGTARIVSRQRLDPGDLVYLEGDSCGNIEFSVIAESG